MVCSNDLFSLINTTLIIYNILYIIHYNLIKNRLNIKILKLFKSVTIISGKVVGY